MLKLRSRTLLNNGISIVDLETMVETILAGDIPEHIKTEECSDTKKYKIKYGTDLSHPLIDSIIEPKILIDTEDELNTLNTILNSHRHDQSSKEASDRLDHELNFFNQSNHIDFLCVLHKLIKRFKKDGVVWGCGRGSSCASYVLYLLEVHDVDPIKYGINFKEFSKED